MSVHGVDATKIVGKMVAYREATKQILANGIADALGLSAPDVSKGSSVDSLFLDQIHAALNQTDTTAANAYRKAERVLQDLGLTYDPFWDTSESAPAGGSTVTNRAYSRIRAAVTRTPRCFIVTLNDAEATHGGTDHEIRYSFSDNVRGRSHLLDAGPGSRILYYAARKHHSNPMHFIAHAEVTYISPGWTGPWTATIDSYTEFNRPVPVGEFQLEGWNRQLSVTEIAHGTYLDLLRAGNSLSREVVADMVQDPGGDVVAKRVIEQIPLPATAPDLEVPSLLPFGEVTLQPPREPVYKESNSGTSLTTGDLPTPRNVARNQLAETRGVELATQALEAQGWRLVVDQQKAGVGYDLHVQKGDRSIHAEVKGIISSTLAFNLTPKEAWRAETDDNFAVIAVTNVLSPTAFKLHFLTRPHLTGAERIITGYRLKF